MDKAVRSYVTVRCMFVFVDVHCKLLREVVYIAFLFSFSINQILVGLIRRVSGTKTALFLLI